MTRFIHDNLELDMDNSARAKLYKDNQLIFVGNGYIAIKMMITESGNSPAVIQRFRAQLDQREKPRFEKSERHQGQGSSN